MAAREILRRPRAFLVPVAILALLALLLLYPSSILDGLVRESTAAMRNAPSDLLVYAESANGVMARSTIQPPVREAVDNTRGTARVATFDSMLFSGTVEGHTEPLGFALSASDQPLAARSPAPGEAIVDPGVRSKADIREGTVIHLGPNKVPVTVAGFATGFNLFFSNGMLVHKATLLHVLSGVQLEPAVAQGVASQALLVTVDKGSDPLEVAEAIDLATNGTTQTMTREAAIKALPGISEQEAIFGYMRAITLTVALVVVALFLSFMTLERAPLYAALKAIGAASWQLFFAVVAQVLLITATAVTTAALITWSLTRLPSEMPTIMQANRVVETTFALALTAVLGAGLSLRRVVNVDPADAIG